MADATSTPAPQPKGATGVVVFADGRLVWGKGFGAEGSAVGELCFNTAMTGYQEVMTDPSYARQVIAFTFPHIGNVGANDEDVEAEEAHALGAIVREAVTAPSNYRSGEDFTAWMARRGRIGISGVDTRALTRLVREEGPPTIAVAHSEAGEFDIEALQRMAADWPGLEGMDLAKAVSRLQVDRWTGGKWAWGQGYEIGAEGDDRPHVVAVDYGAKRNIFRSLCEAGARVTIVPASASFDEIMGHEPDGFFLSNGPGDPAATGEYAIPVIRQMLDSGKPLFGICLGHQLLALAVGGMTSKMFQGHRGANHPVKRLEDGRVEITSMNHGFAVRREGLPGNVRETHVSLFDDSNCGIELADKPAFSVQYHPEASPGPQDSFYLFEKFVGKMRANLSKSKTAELPSTQPKQPRRRLPLGRTAGLPKVGNSLRVLINRKRASVTWLEPTSPIPRELATGLIRASAWWHTHSSGRPVRASGHADRVFGQESTWQIKFGANTFQVARAIRLSCRFINQAYDDLAEGRNVNVRKLRTGIKHSVQSSISNVNGDLYDLYPLDGQEVMLGAQSIHVEDVANYLLRESGLTGVIGVK